MSEKMYTRLLRIYPSTFRKNYEGEALQLIRDRLRDETGFFKRAASLVGPRDGFLNWATAGVPELVRGNGGNVAFAQCRWHSDPSRFWTRSRWGLDRFSSLVPYLWP